MTTLYIDRNNLELRLEGGALTCYEDGQRVGTIPTAPLERVVMRGTAKVETQAIAKLGSLGVGVIFLFGRRHEPVLFLPRPHNDALIRIHQCVLSRNPEACRLVAVDILQTKIEAQRQFLQSRADALKDTAPKALVAATDNLRKLWPLIDAKASEPAIRGVEGRAARVYFEGLTALFPAELGFTGRNRKPPRDPVNAALSLSYVLLYADAAIAAHQAGLDPFVGFLHKPEFGRHSLACDLMEPARPLVDRFVLDLFESGLFTLKSFSTTDAGCFISKNARSVFYPAFKKAASEWRGMLAKRARKLADDILTYAKEH